MNRYFHCFLREKERIDSFSEESILFLFANEIRDPTIKNVKSTGQSVEKAIWIEENKSSFKFNPRISKTGDKPRTGQLPPPPLS